MGTFILWFFSLLATTAGFVWLYSAAPDIVFAIAAMALTLMSAQLVVAALVMDRLVNGLGRSIKNEWLGNRAAEIAVLAATYALVFVVDYFVDFKHLQLQPTVGFVLSFLAIFIASIFFTTTFTGGFLARNYRRPTNSTAK